MSRLLPLCKGLPGSCYKKMEGGQAQVIQENCIACGTCIDECPQHAKAYRTDAGKVLQWIDSETPMVLSIAPSFATSYSEWEQKTPAVSFAFAGVYAHQRNGCWCLLYSTGHGILY